jgi:hypothetical protein
MTPILRSRLYLLVLIAAVLALFGGKLVAPALAFTIDDQSNTNRDGSARFADPDERFSGTGNGVTTYRQGNMSLQFGNQRSIGDQRYNADRMFNPNGRPGDYDGR